jgi:RNA polymerase sigma-70 factor (ECF subfamily)
MTGALQQFRDGDAGALDQLIEAYARTAFAAAMAVLGDRAQAEQSVKEALVAALDDVERYDPAQQSEVSWLLGHVRANAVRGRRNRTPHRRRETTFEPDPVWRTIMLGADVEMVHQALETLSEAQNETVSLAYWKGLRPSEIARMRGVPEEIVRTNLRVGLERLREAMTRTGREGRSP